MLRISFDQQKNTDQNQNKGNRHCGENCNSEPSGTNKLIQVDKKTKTDKRSTKWEIMEIIKGGLDIIMDRNVFKKKKKYVVR